MVTKPIYLVLKQGDRFFSQRAAERASDKMRVDVSERKSAPEKAKQRNGEKSRTPAQNSAVDKIRNMKHSGTPRNIPEHPGTWIKTKKKLKDTQSKNF